MPISWSSSPGHSTLRASPALCLHTPYIAFIAQLTQLSGYRGRIVVSGCLSRAQKDRHCSTPTTAIFSFSATARNSSGSIISVQPACRARQESFACAMFLSVLGPTVGMSYRSSWSSLIIFTTVPPTQRDPALRSVASVPSIASTATTERLLTTTVCPKERGTRALHIENP